MACSRRALGTPQVLPLDCPGPSVLRTGDMGVWMGAPELGEFALLSEVSEICTCSLGGFVYHSDRAIKCQAYSLEEVAEQRESRQEHLFLCSELKATTNKEAKNP